MFSVQEGVFVLIPRILVTEVTGFLMRSGYKIYLGLLAATTTSTRIALILQLNIKFVSYLCL